MARDSFEAEADRQITAEIGDLLGGPLKRLRPRPIPPHLKTKAGRFALSLWRKQQYPSQRLGASRDTMAVEQYEKWWMGLLDADTRNHIKAAIEPFKSYEAFRAAYLKHLRPAATFSEVGPEGLCFDQLLEKLPQCDFDTFIGLLSGPVAQRSEYAEWFGKQATKILKDFLEVRSGRPKGKPSKSDLEDDEWMCRLAAYIWNFPEKSQ